MTSNISIHVLILKIWALLPLRYLVLMDSVLCILWNFISRINYIPILYFTNFALFLIILMRSVLIL